MVENQVAQSIKAQLVESGYDVIYSENSGRIFGYDILKKNFGNGNTVQTIIRNHMISAEVSDKSMKVIHRTSFESIDEHEEFSSLVTEYFSVIAGIYGKSAT